MTSVLKSQHTSDAVTDGRLLSDEQMRLDTCPNIPQDVFVQCGGCHPIMAAFADFERVYPMSETTRQAVSSCFKSSATFNVQTLHIVNAGLNLCTEKNISLDEAQKNALIRLLDTYINGIVTSDYAQQWDACASQVSRKRLEAIENAPSVEPPAPLPLTVPAGTSSTNDAELKTTPTRRNP